MLVKQPITVYVFVNCGKRLATRANGSAATVAA